MSVRLLGKLNEQVFGLLKPVSPVQLHNCTNHITSYNMPECMTTSYFIVATCPMPMPIKGDQKDQKFISQSTFPILFDPMNTKT